MSATVLENFAIAFEGGVIAVFGKCTMEFENAEVRA
jgi:hypothetical protein